MSLLIPCWLLVIILAFNADLFAYPYASDFLSMCTTKSASSSLPAGPSMSSTKRKVVILLPNAYSTFIALTLSLKAQTLALINFPKERPNSRFVCREEKASFHGVSVVQNSDVLISEVFESTLSWFLRTCQDSRIKCLSSYSFRKKNNYLNYLLSNVLNLASLTLFCFVFQNLSPSTSFYFSKAFLNVPRYRHYIHLDRFLFFSSYWVPISRNNPSEDWDF